MLRLFAGSVSRAITPTNLFNAATLTQKIINRSICNVLAQNNSSTILKSTNVALNRWFVGSTQNENKGLLSAVNSSLLGQPARTVTKFSLNKGKRKSVKAVIKRFKRLDWGIWIRTHTGRHKKLFKKSPPLKRRLRQHIFVNATQSMLLDKMVTNFWRRPKHYIDDPYEPYHTRDEYFATKSKTLKV